MKGLVPTLASFLIAFNAISAAEISAVNAVILDSEVLNAYHVVETDTA